MYIIEGNIGAGKSTFLALLAHAISSVHAVQEPRHQWQGADDKNSLLAHFYRDPRRWAYTMETYALMCRVNDYRAALGQGHAYAIGERSLYSGYYCFTKNGYENGFLSPLEWRLYNAWFTFLVEKKCPLPRGFIYLRTQPEKAFARIYKRNRVTERDISLAYIQQIHSCYEQFLVTQTEILPSLRTIPVLVLDADQEFETDAHIAHAYVQQVKTFIGIAD